MTNDFIADIESLFETKREFVNRIVTAAEELQFKHDFKDDDRYAYDNVKKLYNHASTALFKFFLPFFFNDYDEREEKVKDMKKWHQMRMEKDPVFGDIPVNLNHSAIHVPLNVFNEKPEIKNGTKWSEGLTQVFKENRAIDSELNWQYFCSDDGFLRLYPATNWRTPQYDNISDDQPSLDLYDCRLQSWYTKAASSPKDLVILWDLSGSMTGQRKAISHDVVLNILDSLTDDDFVAVIGFNDSLYYAVSCFNQQLVEANVDNIQILKKSLWTFNQTGKEANFSLALETAFAMLERFRSYDEQEAEKRSSKCNQAIMLITDGAPETYDETFERYNKEQGLPVRVFTYLIGKEVVDTQEVYRMACENRGYYTHVANTAEVREQVQRYIAVMSRPLVLSKVHPFAFTPVYADIEAVPLLNWVWELRESGDIRQSLRKNLQKMYSEQDEADSVFDSTCSGVRKNKSTSKKERVTDEAVFEDYEDIVERNKAKEEMSVSINARSYTMNDFFDDLFGASVSNSSTGNETKKEALEIICGKKMEKKSAKKQK
ncbi:voltage-dependent calcium channel subunit alpha-2/delta-3-like protein, partial [Dinothrombium tinctorium]